jgi:DMSO/TMAO reductase YedYZ molybdopterin-dependent catalytic subunit
MRSLTPSPFRPSKPVDQTVMQENRKLVESVGRRAFLRGTLSLGALTMLTGCDVTNKDATQSVLRAMSAWNDRVQAFLFSPTRLAREYPASRVMRPPRWNAFYGREMVKDIDPSTWKLELGGMVGDKRPWALRDIHALPEVTQRTRHVCVEGWDYIGEWTGVPLKLFLERIGADTTAKYVGFKCIDGYTGSIDMASALHPQTQLTTKYGGEVLHKDFGFPIRLRVATKLGFKSPKQIVAMEVTNTYPGGYWENRRYNWFSGI